MSLALYEGLSLIKGHHFYKLTVLQQYLNSGDWDDVEELPEKLEAYKGEPQ